MASAFLGLIVEWRSWTNNYIISVVLEAVKEKPMMFRAAAGAWPLLYSLNELVVVGKKAWQADNSKMRVTFIREREAGVLCM